MRVPVILLFILFSVPAFSQYNMKYELSIDSMKEEDQKYCKIVVRVGNGETDSIKIKEALALQQACFESNFVLSQYLFDTYGFPSQKKVGWNASMSYWLIIQHMDLHPDFQKRILDSMTAGIKDSLTHLINWAYLTDRVEVNFGRKQVYGTQMMLNNDSSSFIYKPTIDDLRLEERRKSVGLFPMTEYIQVMNKRYYGSLKRKESVAPPK